MCLCWRGGRIYAHYMCACVGQFCCVGGQAGLTDFIKTVCHIFSIAVGGIITSYLITDNFMNR